MLILKSLKVAKGKAATRKMRYAHRKGYRMEGGVSSRVSRWRRGQGLSCNYVIKDRTDRGGKVAL